MGRSTALANIEAMPASLRCVLFQLLLLRPSLAHAQPRQQSIRCVATASASSRSKAAKKRSPTAPPQPPPPPQSSQLSALSYIPPPSNIPNGNPAARALQPSASSLGFASSLFLQPPPRFLYSAPRFLNVPINTRVPEICVLGRSNVGKSTLINALAGVASARAGRSHGPASTRAGIAITSAKAGSTRAMNAYGFGPPMSVAPRAKAAAAAVDDDTAAMGAEAEAENENIEGDTNKITTKSSSGSGSGSGSGTSTRSQRRSRTIIREAPPRHSFVLMDMPGYGLNSRSEWGVEVGKYLTRRGMLRGAVVLIDAVAGVKDGDRAVLGLLRDSGVRTLVVLTKADKVAGHQQRHGDGSGVENFVDVEAVMSRCAEVWTELRELETESLAWTEDHGWEKEVWVSGAGDPKNGSLGVAGVRFAIAKMAGLLEDRREADRRRKAAAAGPSRIVPFDEIQWAPEPKQQDPNRPSF